MPNSAAISAVVNARPAPPTSLARWATSELGPNAVLHADPLDRAELLAGGVAAERLRDLDAPARTLTEVTREIFARDVDRRRAHEEAYATLTGTPCSGFSELTELNRLNLLTYGMVSAPGLEPGTL